MNIILLSGGSGKRLWPLSNEVRSKQFLKILKNPAGQPESMLQYIYRNLATLASADSSTDSVSTQTSQTSQPTVCNKGGEDYNSDGNKDRAQQDQHGQERQQKPIEITIATSANQVSSIRSQLGDSVGISIEPCRRDTFPAIALATAYLHDICGVSRDETAIVCPVDPYVEQTYFKVIKDMYDLTGKEAGEAGEAEKDGIVLMGIEPTYPSEKYGYIIPQSDAAVSRVREFKEKPDVPTAEKYIAAGAMWNGGVFAFKLSYLLNKAQALLGYSSYNDLLVNYATLPKISFDYAVVEKEPNVTVIRYAGAWKDLGTWNTLTEAMSEAVSGNATAPLSVNTHVINELQIPLIALGVRDLAIAATPDGILVTDKKSSDKLKDYVVENRPMYEKRLWGEYKVLDIFSTATMAASTSAGNTSSSPAHSKNAINPVNDCVYTHNEAGETAGKDTTAISSNAVDAVNSAAVVAAQAPVANTLKSSMAENADNNAIPNIWNNRNIQTINGAAKTGNTINTVNPVVNAGNVADGAAVAVSAESCCNSLTKHLIIKPGNHISYQLHRHRSEIWTFISGHGRLILDGQVKEVGVGDVVKIAAGVKHGIQAIPATALIKATNDGNAVSTDNALHIIEVQIGDELTEEDIERFDWPITTLDSWI